MASESQTYYYAVTQREVGMRVDVFLAREHPGYSRSFIRKLIDSGQAFLNGAPVKGNHRVKRGEQYELTFPPPEEGVLRPENIPLEILYEDGEILVINKAEGIAVHPAEGTKGPTLVNALLHHCDTLSEVGGEAKRGIVHRLDRDTTGAMVIAKTDDAHLALAEQFRRRTVKKIYVALCWGNIPQDECIVELPIGRHPVKRQMMTIQFDGRPSKTRVRVLERLPGTTLAEARIFTGRTHQIRVHLSHLGFPIVGDAMYGRWRHDPPLPQGDRIHKLVKSQLLHARRLGFHHPGTGEWVEFEAPLPKTFQTVLDILRTQTEGMDGDKGQEKSSGSTRP